MKIGLEIFDSSFGEIDASRPELGNPGMGGSEYALLMLAKYYGEAYGEDEVIVYHHSPDVKYPACVRDVFLDGKSTAEAVAGDHADIYIGVLSDYSVGMTETMQKKAPDAKLIWIAECFPTAERLQCMNRFDNVKRVVFVGKEEYDCYLDDDVMEKACVIGNMINNKLPICGRDSDLKPVVTYMGNLLPQKGFHMLAKQWKKVLRQVPEAQLNVIGTGRLYERDKEMGSYGLAPQEYEKQFMPYLTDERGEILSSVHFLGLVAQGKEEIFNHTMVGVVNPTAITETFCNCAVEMQACGVPIVTRRKNSFLDVVGHRYSGLLFRTEYGFRRNLIRLLKDRELNERMGRNAAEYSERFSPETLLPVWRRVIQGVYEAKSASYLGCTGNLFHNRKVCKVINRFLRFHLGMKFLPSRSGGSPGKEKKSVKSY